MSARHHIAILAMTGAIGLGSLLGLVFVVTGTGFLWDDAAFGAIAAAGVLAGLLLAVSLLRWAVAIVRGREYPWADVAADIPLLAGCLGLVTAAYTWGKLLVPGMNPRLWDAELWRVDQALCFGLDPNRVLVSIFHDNPRWVGWALDAEYNSFVLLLLAGALWLLTEPDRAVRLRSAGCMGVLWLAGLTAYVALPASGPALVDLDLWRQVLAVFPNAAGMERELLRNALAVKQALAGAVVAVNPCYGIAAFPSLHVAAHLQLALLFGARSRRAGWAWGVIAGLTFVGSVATGWHYLVDSLAGVVLALVCTPFATSPVAPAGPPTGQWIA